MKCGFLKVMLNGLMVIKEIRKNNVYNFKVETIIKSKAIITKDDEKLEIIRLWLMLLGHTS